MSTDDFIISPSLPPAPDSMPLDERITRLVEKQNFMLVTNDNAAEFAGEEGDNIILLTADPRAYPETWDVAVVLPEVLKTVPNRYRAAVADPIQSVKLAARFGVQVFPALIFQRSGGFVGTLEGMQDWDSYLRLIPQMLERPTSRAPSIGIPVVSSTGSGSSCH